MTLKVRVLIRKIPAPPHGKTEGHCLRWGDCSAAGPGLRPGSGTVRAARFPHRRDRATLAVAAVRGHRCPVLPRNSRRLHETALPVSARPRHPATKPKVGTRRGQRQDVAASAHLAKCEERQDRHPAASWLENSRRNCHPPVVCAQWHDCRVSPCRDRAGPGAGLVSVPSPSRASVVSSWTMAEQEAAHSFCPQLHRNRGQPWRRVGTPFVGCS